MSNSTPAWSRIVSRSTGSVNFVIPQSVWWIGELPGPQQPAADQQRPDHVVGGPATGVPDHVCVADVEPEERRGIHTRVDARQDHERSRRRNLEISLVEALRERSVALLESIDL
jgi:hypothetical protein